MILPKPALGSPLVDCESDLVRRARSGDVVAREELALRHRRSAYLLALQLLGNVDDAMDVAQDAMLRFFSNLHRFDTRRPVRPWLCQIVRNRVVDLLRHRKIRNHDSLDLCDDEGNPRFEPIDERVDLHGDAANAELRAQIWRALKKLSRDQREILVLRDYQDLSYAEIAEALAIPLGTVMSRLHGARKRLRHVLQEDSQCSTRAGAACAGAAE